MSDNATSNGNGVMNGSFPDSDMTQEHQHSAVEGQTPSKANGVHPNKNGVVDHHAPLDVGKQDNDVTHEVDNGNLVNKTTLKPVASGSPIAPMANKDELQEPFVENGHTPAAALKTPDGNLAADVPSNGTKQLDDAASATADVRKSVAPTATAVTPTLRPQTSRLNVSAPVFSPGAAFVSQAVPTKQLASNVEQPLSAVAAADLAPAPAPPPAHVSEENSQNGPAPPTQAEGKSTDVPAQDTPAKKMESAIVTEPAVNNSASDSADSLQTPEIAEAPSSAATPAPVGLGMGLGLRLPPRALRPPLQPSEVQDVLQSMEVQPKENREQSSSTVPALRSSSASPLAPSTSSLPPAAPARPADSPDVSSAGKDASSITPAAVSPQPTDLKQAAAPSPALTKPSGLGSGLPLKAKPAVAKRAKAQPLSTTTAATGASSTAVAGMQVSDDADEEVTADEQDTLANAKIAQRVPIRHATKLEECRHLSALVLQELKYLQSYHRQHAALSNSSDELATLIEAGRALGLGVKLGRMNRYIEKSSLAVGDEVNLQALLDMAESRGFSKLRQQLIIIKAESAADQVTAGWLLARLAQKVSSSHVNSIGNESDRPIEEVVAELDQAVEARALLEQKQLLNFLNGENWSAGFSDKVELPKTSPIRASVNFVLGLPLLPFKAFLGLVKPSRRAEIVVDQERLETRRLQARLKLLRAYQQAVCEPAGAQE